MNRNRNSLSLVVASFLFALSLTGYVLAESYGDVTVRTRLAVGDGVVPGTDGVYLTGTAPRVLAPRRSKPLSTTCT